MFLVRHQAFSPPSFQHNLCNENEARSYTRLCNENEDQHSARLLTGNENEARSLHSSRIVKENETKSPHSARFVNENDTRSPQSARIQENEVRPHFSARLVNDHETRPHQSARVINESEQRCLQSSRLVNENETRSLHSERLISGKDAKPLHTSRLVCENETKSQHIARASNECEVKSLQGARMINDCEVPRGANKKVCAQDLSLCCERKGSVNKKNYSEPSSSGREIRITQLNNYNSEANPEADSGMRPINFINTECISQHRRNQRKVNSNSENVQNCIGDGHCLMTSDKGVRRKETKGNLSKECKTEIK